MTAHHALVDADPLPRDAAIDHLVVVNPYAEMEDADGIGRRADVAISNAYRALLIAGLLVAVWFAVELFRAKGIGR